MTSSKVDPRHDATTTVLENWNNVLRCKSLISTSPNIFSNADFDWIINFLSKFSSQFETQRSNSKYRFQVEKKFTSYKSFTGDRLLKQKNEMALT